MSTFHFPRPDRFPYRSRTDNPPDHSRLRSTVIMLARWHPYAPPLPGRRRDRSPPDRPGLRETR